MDGIAEFFFWIRIRIRIRIILVMGNHSASLCSSTKSAILRGKCPNRVCVLRLIICPEYH